MPLHINIKDLLEGKIVENDRIEYKQGWNPGAVYRTICAFANDIDDIGGGYIIIGVQEKDGRPILPVCGVPEEQIDAIQKEMLGLNNLINPAYFPKLSIEDFDGKRIIVIWVLSGSNRPYEVPEEIKSKDKKYFYYIRLMSNSVKANKEQREELISLFNKIPFDDRPNTQVDVSEISFTLLKDHLRQTDSKLLDWVDTHTKNEILSQMALLSGPPELLHPRNVAIMLFTDNPEKYFPQSHVEIVIFPNGADSAEFFELPVISGPIPNQIRQTLLSLRSAVLREKVEKVGDAPESVRTTNYPFQALEEVIANAIYHRDYQTREPVEIRVYPDEMIILNYGGPDRSIKSSAFETGKILPRRYRNRRLGDFLKELDLTEGKATGIPMIKRAMEKNGSPSPLFETDQDRSYFQVTLKIHPFFLPEAADLIINRDASEGGGIKSNEGANHLIAFVKANAIANEGANTTANEGANAERDDSRITEDFIDQFIPDINTRIKPKLLRVFKAILKDQHKRVPDYSKATGINIKSVERYIKKLREADMIDFTEGSTKVGGYFITLKMEQFLLNKEN